MASSRLEKVGTIYSRVRGLLKSGAMKSEDRPLWYDIYEAFPPKYEPTFARPAPNIEIRNVFYPEDKLRADFHKLHGDLLKTVDLNNDLKKSATQKFLAYYKKLEEEGTTPEENLFTTAVEMLKSERQQYLTKDEVKQKEEHSIEEKSDLVSSFKEAQNERRNEEPKKISLSEILKE